MKIAKKLQDLASYDPTTQEFEVVLDANESFLQPEGALRDAIDEGRLAQAAAAVRAGAAPWELG